MKQRWVFTLSTEYSLPLQELQNCKPPNKSLRIQTYLTPFTISQDCRVLHAMHKKTIDASINHPNLQIFDTYEHKQSVEKIHK